MHIINSRQNKLALAISALSMLTVPFTQLSAQESATLQEIIVVGQKIERSLQETKESIAVITAETIETRNLIDLSDVLNQTAGVSGDRTFRVRGINSGPSGTLRSELASFYVDGVALSGWAKSEGPRQMWDVQQVEVMRGPQSTNLGRNSLAGAVVVTTMNPVFENTAAVRAGAGNYGRQELKAMANISLSEGVSALRIAYENSEDDGFTNNITRNEDDFNYNEKEDLRVKWLLQPSDDLKMVFAIQRSENEYGDATLAFEDAGYDREDRISLADVRGVYALESLQVSATIDYQLNDNWSLKSISAHMDSERNRTDDFDNRALDLSSGGGVVIRDADDENFSQEFRFDYSSGSVRGSSGFYYSKIEAGNRNNTQAVLNLEDIINGISPGLGTTFVTFGVYPALFDLVSGGTTYIETINKAVFSEWEMSLNDKWLLSFGARYDQEEQDVSFINTGSTSVTLPNPADWAVLGPAGQGAIGLLNAQLSAVSSDGALFTPESDYDAFLPHIGITYEVNADVSVSAFAKRGYRSGGTEITGLNTVNPYDPEYLSNYEVALRAVVLDGRGIFNANIYRGYWDDQQVNIPEIPDSSTFLIIQNAGESEISGVEAEFQFQMSSNVSLFATLGYNKTEFKNFISGTNDYSGNEFVAAPKVTGAIGAYYNSENGFFGGGTVTYQGDSFGNEANTLKLESRTLANANAGYQTGSYKIEAYVRNLFDEDYSTAEFQVFGRMGAPREYGARITYQF